MNRRLLAVLTSILVAGAAAAPVASAASASHATTQHAKHEVKAKHKAKAKPKHKAKPKPKPNTPPPPPKPELLVNDPAGVGTVGDGLLSLDEALRLANGTLSVSALSSAERAQVQHGQPGAGSADIIRVVLGKGAVITTPASAPKSSGLVRIVGNTGDTLDGGGVVLTGQLPTGVGLIVASSGFTIENLTMTGYNEDLVVDPGGLSLHDITVHAVDLEPAVFGNLAVGARSSNGYLTGLTVTDSRFVGGSAVNSAAPAVLAAANTLGGTVNDSTLENVVFTRNEVSGGLEGFYVYGLEGNGATGVNDVARHIMVSDNWFHDSTDAAMNLDGATGIVDNLGTSGIEDVTMTRNRITANNWAIGIWGGESFGGASVNGAYVRDVSISHNQLQGVPGSPTQCIILEAGRVDFAGLATGNVIDGVNIFANDASTCGESGITVHGGVSAGGGVVTGNVARNIRIADNSVTGTPIGLVLRGGDAGAASVLSGNTTENIQVTGNRFTRATEGLHLVGGEVSTGGVAQGNTLRSVTFDHNTLVGSTTLCTTLPDDGTGATGNTNTVVCPG